MSRHTLTVLPSPARTRLLLTNGPNELLRAALPPPVLVRHSHAASRLLEGLSLWLDHRLRVVLCADAPDSLSWLELTDDLGRGLPSVFYDVDLVSPTRVGRGSCLHGVDDFRLLHRVRRHAS